MFKKIVVTIASIVFFGLMPAFAQEVINLKFAVFTPENEITYQTTMKPWAEKVMKATNGKVHIKLFPGGILGRDGSKQIKLLKSGVADISFIIPAYNPGLFPDDAVIELPNMCQNATEGSIVFWRLLEKKLLRGYEEFQVISMVTSAPSTIHGSVPINKTADLKGVKIRTAQRLQRDLLTALGATPVGMSISKIPESISRGVIDATPMHYAALHAFGIASATKYHYENKLGLMPFGWVMMKDEFAKLPADVQKIMLEYGGENASRMFGQAMDSECERLRKQTLTSKDEVVVTPSKADIENWDAALKPVVDKWIEDHSKGKMLYDALVNELKILRGN